MNTSDSAPIKVKAGRNGFTLIPDPGASFESIRAYMEQRLTESRDFFQHTEMSLDLREKAFRTDEILEIRTLLSERAGVKLIEIKLADELSLVFDRNHLPAPAKVEVPSPVSDAPVIVRNTCRSGHRVVSPSDCVVLGDVNPGAEIIAVGDIIVFGHLRGLAHAGASGDRSARIWALSIEPNQLRIADLVAVPPKGGKPVPIHFEIAGVQDNLIQVSVM